MGRNIPQRELTKDYFDRVNEYYLRHYKIHYKKGPWSKKSIDLLIEHVQEAVKRKEQNLEMESHLERYYKTYEVYKDNKTGKNLLVLKGQTQSKNDIKIVLATEETLTVFLENTYNSLTLKMHQDTTKLVLQRRLKGYIYLSKCLDIFIEVFSHHKVVKPTKNKVLNAKIGTFMPAISCGRLQIICPFPERTNYYSYLLIYLEMRSNFVVLRPLVTKSDIEVTMELYKIFLEYGPPLCLLVHRIEPDFYEKVFQRLEQLTPVLKVACVSKTTNMRISNKVMQNLERWRSQNTSCWSIGCYIAQWMLNTNKTSSEPQPECNLQPFHVLFKYRR